MPRLTVIISDEHEEILQRNSDLGEAYRSKSEVIRECIEAFDRVEDLSEQLACLEAEVEMLRDQRAQLKQKAARVDELEGKLRQLQAAYHQAIDEGRSPRELDPVETELEPEPSATALIEEAESNSDEPKAVEAASESTSGSVPGASGAQGTAAPSQTIEQSSTRQPPEQTTRSPSAEQRAQSRASTGRHEESRHAASATDGGVEIDEELLYQSPSVGSRIKSALFGGPGGSR